MLLHSKYLVTNCALALTVFFGFNVAWPAHSWAVPVTYDYSGTDATDPGSKLSGFLTIDSSYFTGMGDVDIPTGDISSFSFTAIIPTQSPPGITWSLGDVQTLPPGKSIQFDLTTTPPTLLQGFDGQMAINSLGYAIYFLNTKDIQIDLQPPYIAVGGFSGTWTAEEGGSCAASAVCTTPIPATFPLLATGLGALGLFGWRKKRKTAAALAAA